MIDNQLKKCCEECEHDDVFAATDFKMKKGRKYDYPAKCTVIGCKHMYVCKKYIENQEADG